MLRQAHDSEFEAEKSTWSFCAVEEGIDGRRCGSVKPAGNQQQGHPAGRNLLSKGARASLHGAASLRGIAICTQVNMQCLREQT